MWVKHSEITWAPFLSKRAGILSSPVTLFVFSFLYWEQWLRKVESTRLRNVARGCCDNNFMINPDKTKLLFIGDGQLISGLPSSPTVTFLGKPLKPSASAKDLGVILDPHLTYNDHVSKVVFFCFSSLCQINRVKMSFDSKTLLLVISTLVFSKTLYCSSAWSNTLPLI